MRENYRSSLQAVLKYEGGYSNHPADPGGPTMKGVTQRVYDAWRKRQGLTPQSVKNISQSELEALYKRDYWDVIRGDDLPAGIDLATFDYAVNSGTNRAVKHLQATLSLMQTGIMNAEVISAANKNPKAWAALCDRRLAFLKSLGTWSTFGRGWGDRVADVRRKAAALAATNAPEKIVPGVNVEAAQRRLAELSYPLGSFDGKVGPLTRSAVRDFQDAMGETVTGELDSQTYSLLMSDSAIKRPVSSNREALTKVDLMQHGSTIVTAADKIKANVATATGALAGAAGIAGQVNDVAGQIQNIKDVVKTGHESASWFYANWQLIAIAVLLAMVVVCVWTIWRQASVVENERVRQARTGENVRV